MPDHKFYKRLWATAKAVFYEAIYVTMLYFVICKDSEHAKNLLYAYTGFSVMLSALVFLFILTVSEELKAGYRSIVRCNKTIGKLCSVIGFLSYGVLAAEGFFITCGLLFCCGIFFGTVKTWALREEDD